MPPKDAALALAQQALHKIETHEAVCNVRWGNIEKYMEDAKNARVLQHHDNLAAIKSVKESVAGLYNWRFKAAMGLVAGMLVTIISLVAYIYTNGGPNGAH